MKNFSALFIYLLLVTALFTGCVSFNYRIADNYYEQYAYAKAIPKYEKVLNREFIPDAASKIAESYRKTGNSIKAELWYKRLVSNPEVTLQNKLALGEVLMENGKYSEAKPWLQDYLAFNNTDKRVKRLIQACDSIHLFFSDTNVYSVSLLKLNKAEESNFSPSFYNDGIIFLSDRSAPGKNKVKSVWTGKEYLDIFFSRETGEDNWSEPEMLKGDVNGLYDEGPAVISPDSSTIYFTRTDYSGKNVETNQRDESNLKLYYGRLTGNKWTVEGPLKFNNEDYSVGHPSLSPDGSTMFFVSDMPWGYGGTDIYKVTLINGAWSDPVNLGAGVNTEGNEMFPFISADSILYFASDGHIGLGGLDIFSSNWNGEKWMNAENLQYPVNSSKDDFGFIINSSNLKGYFSSNRLKNVDKLFGFKKNPPVFSLKLLVHDVKKKTPLNSFNIATIDKNKKLKNIATGKEGRAEVSLQQNTAYQLLIKENGFYAAERKYSTAGLRKSTVITDTVSLEKIELNKARIWSNISFNRKETAINKNTSMALDSLVNIMTLNPEITIEIASHTDSRGTFPDNLAISKKRSDEIVEYLVKKGIKASRMISMGYGEVKLLNNCRDGILCLEEDHKINNRTEIKVVDILK
jgi:peptidoglycan-associated lipoprotein